MSYIQRRLLDWAFSEDMLKDRMCFLSGPRQIGKTTAVEHFLKEKNQSRLYYNWDTPTVKKNYAKNPLFFVEDLPAETKRPWVALDEIHKYPKWKNILKGYYDELKARVRFIVTGSARLDLFRRSGDSLVGRYFLFRMLPLGVKEVLSRSPAETPDWSPEQELLSFPQADAQVHDALQNLLNLTGYPEPFVSASQAFSRRWRDNHVSLILKEDLKDLTKIVQIRKIETLLYLLPERVGSPLSLNALRSPLEAAHGSIRTWLEALKMVYLVFSLSPWTSRLSRSVLREEKYYFWDWGMVENSGARFENFIAVQLERIVNGWNERGQGSYKLYYLRTKDGHEADFAVASRKQVLLLVEAKESDMSLSTSLSYLQKKTGAPLAIQVVNQKGFCVQKDKGLYVMGADRFLSFLF